MIWGITQEVLKEDPRNADHSEWQMINKYRVNKAWVPQVVSDFQRLFRAMLPMGFWGCKRVWKRSPFLENPKLGRMMTRLMKQWIEPINAWFFQLSDHQFGESTHQSADQPSFLIPDFFHGFQARLNHEIQPFFRHSMRTCAGLHPADWLPGFGPDRASGRV